MSGLVAGLALAVVASCALNAAFLFQHAGVATAPAVTVRHPVSVLRGLIASRAWVGGLALGLSGWALHVAALTRAPLSLVQAFVAGGLALTVPAARRWLRQPVTRREAAAVAAMAGALALLAIGTSGEGRSAGFSAAALAAWIGAAALLAALLAAAPANGRRAETLGLAGGVLYGAADTAIKALTAGWSPALLVAAALTTAGAFFAFQRGLQLGRAVPVIALMTAGTYVVSILAGVAVFGDPLGGGALAVAHAGAFAVVVGAAWVLAPAQAGIAETVGTPSAGLSSPG
jgi:drug/metabolite transporter (DMT)-like permease